MHPLDGAHFKLARAYSQIDIIKSMEISYFKETKHSIVRAEYNPVSGKDIYRIKIDGPPPSLDWGVYIGEIAHNLRSALNYLVYQLALLNPANRPETVARDKRLQFPIFTDVSEYRRNGESTIRLLTPKHKAIIEGLQPYNSVSSISLPTIDLSERSGRRSPLFWLEEINNMDKHRLIHVTGVKAGSYSVAYWGDINNPIKDFGTFSILEDGAEFLEALPEVHVNTQIHPLIAFAPTLGFPPEIEKRAVCLTFNLIAKTVSRIIGLFEPEFS
jgi:hypothetical protein